ncbi:MAG: sugar-binding domain-containing protein, partial [Sediminibacterium sp.]
MRYWLTILKSKLLCCLIIGLLIFLNSINAQVDQFAKIGAQKYVLQKDLLVEPGPPILKNKMLPIGIASAQAIEYNHQISTKQELQLELDSIKKHYAGFLKSFSPIQKNIRQKLPIETMQWRIETIQDQQNFKNTLEGKGDWQEVNMPHYGPPIGHAVTYYSKEIILNEDILSLGSLFTCFKGVDYKAEVYFNNVFIGKHEGFFAPFEFDVIKYAHKGKNTLLVKVINEPTTTGSVDENGVHTVGNKIYAAGGLGYDEPKEGWHICPPAMGIYQDCYLEARSTLFLSDIFVRPITNESKAEVWLEIFNTEKEQKNISINLSLFGENFKATIFENQTYLASTTHIPGIGDLVKPTDWQTKSLPMQYGVNYIKIPISIPDFKWWEPNTPWLYNLQVNLLDATHKLTDQLNKNFGMRSFEMDTVNIPKGKMFLNGKPIRLRGANSMGFEQNDVKNKNWSQLIDDILLAKLANMNFLRFTQRPVQSEVYDYCDKLGMLNQTDLPLFGGLRVNQFTEAVKQAEEMERLVRSHPSTVVVTYMNERFPNAEGSPQRSFDNSAAIYKVFSAMDQAVLLSNPDRVIKAGDGDYDPPSPGLPDAHCYNTWYNGHALDLGKFYKGYWQLIKPNWMYGCGEFGAEGLDPLNTMMKYYPKEWLPQNDDENKVWTANKISKSQTNTFHYMWYPTQVGLENWINESQDFQAWAMKLVAESFRRDNRNVSAAVHLFIDAWPAGWMKAIMDVDRQPKKAFFAYRNALAPLLPTIRSDRNSFMAGDTAQLEAWISNDQNNIPLNHTIQYEVFINGKTIVRQMVKADILSNASQFQGFIKFVVPEVASRTIAKVKLGVFDEKGICIEHNSLDLEVFPFIKKSTQKLFVLGDKLSKANTIATDFQFTNASDINNAQVLIVDGPKEYAQYKNEIKLFVQKGGKAILNEWPNGDYEVEGNKFN